MGKPKACCRWSGPSWPASFIKNRLTRFLPARLSNNGSEITPLPWQGSGDVPTLAQANAFLVTDPDREAWAAGDWIRVLLK